MWDDAANGLYTDADGITEEFTSEWQAEAYRQELQEQAFTEQAQSLINDFCQSEYGNDADFSDLTKIGVAYGSSRPPISEILSLPLPMKTRTR